MKNLERVKAALNYVDVVFLLLIGVVATFALEKNQSDFDRRVVYGSNHLDDLEEGSKL